MGQKNNVREMRLKCRGSQKLEDSEMKNLTDDERHRDSRLLSLMQREMAAGRWRFKANAFCQELNCTLDELLVALDRLLCTGCVSAVGPALPKHGQSDGQN